jgi:cytochrome c-type biogenesis protein CcmH
MMFVFIVVAMLVAAGACLFIPLVWRRHKSAFNPANSELAAHKRALEKLDLELADSRIPMSEYLSTRAALEKALQARLGQLESKSSVIPVSKPRWKTATMTLLALVIVVTGFYLTVGNWHAALGGDQTAAQDTEAQMVAGLAHRLATTDSGDANGWTMLGRSYVVLGRYPEAVQAYAHAYALTGDGNPNLLADYAEAIILADPNKLTTDAQPLLSKALHLAPDNAKALWYSGLLAFAQHDKSLAIQRWQKLLQQNLPAGVRSMVVKQIQEAGGTVATRDTAMTVGKRVIPVRVMIDPRLAKHVPADSTLFVFVRPAGSDSGPPLLATRLRLGKLPASIELSDANAMIPGTSLAEYSEVDVIARLSLKGDADAQPGDMEGQTLFKFAPKLHVAMVNIDRVIP